MADVNAAALALLQDWMAVQKLAVGFCMNGTDDSITSRIQVTEAKLENVELDDHDMPRPIKGKRVKSMVVCEITVTQDMLNAGGNLHGGCSAWLLDVCTSLALIPFQAIDGWEYTGVTTDLQARYLAPAPEGTRLRMVSELLQIGGRFGIVDFRIYNADNQQLILAGSHTKASTTARKWKL